MTENLNLGSEWRIYPLLFCRVCLYAEAVVNASSFITSHNEVKQND